MASTYSNLKFELIGVGEQSGTWGSTTNVNLGTAIEEAIVGRATANFSADSDLTISLTNSNSTQVARNYILNVTSGVTLTTTRNLIVPSINKPYIIENNTTGGQSITVKTAAGTGVLVPNGRKLMVYANSTNVVALDYLASLILGAALPVASGGTGASTNSTALSNLGGMPIAGGTFTGSYNEVGLTSIASATTVDLNTVNSNNVLITHASGTTAISSFGTALAAGARRTVYISITTGTLTLALGVASGQPYFGGGISTITLSTDDVLEIERSTSGVWAILSYKKADGTALNGVTLGANNTWTGTNTFNSTVTITTGTINGITVGQKAVGARTIQTVASGTPTGGANGDIVYQY